MNAKQKYELIRPILMHEKTPKQVNEEANVPLSSIYRYLKRFREGGEKIESLADRSHAIRSHPKRFTQEDKNKVVQCKLQYPQLSSRKIAKALAEKNILKISYHSVADILKERYLASPFFPTDHQN